VFEGVSGCEWHKNVQSASPAGFGIPPDSCLFQCIVESQCRFPNDLERGGRASIKIEDGQVGLREVRSARTPQVDFDGSLVGEPEQARCRVDQRQRHRVADGLGLVWHSPQPLGRISWAVTQVVRGSLDSLWVHAQCHRAVFEIGEQDRAICR
jgi:hypothetical protein